MRNRLLRAAYGAYVLRNWVTRPVTLGVRLMLVQAGGVLLVRPSYRTHWIFPGGLVDRGETPEQAAQREAYEEAGVVLRSRPCLFGVYTSFDEYKSDHVLVFVSEDFGLAPWRRDWEIDGRAVFDLHALPPQTSRATRHRLAEYSTQPGPISGAW